MNSENVTVNLTDPVICADFILVIEDDQECSSRIKHMYTVACSEYDGPEGPHVFSRATGQIWRLSLVVNDSHLAFVHGVLPGGPQEGHFSSVPVSSSKIHENFTKT